MITFTSDAYENISYFNDVAKQLLQAMGHSGAIPGALKTDEIPSALSQLQKNAATGAIPAAGAGDEEEPEISLNKRAIPLINMLQAAINKKADVLWS